MEKEKKQLKKFGFNYDAIPHYVEAADIGNALLAILTAIDISIDENRYLRLPDDVKKYWKLKSLT